MSVSWYLAFFYLFNCDFPSLLNSLDALSLHDFNNEFDQNWSWWLGTSSVCLGTSSNNHVPETQCKTWRWIIDVWGVFSEALVKIDGTMNSDMCQDIFVQNLDASVRRQLVCISIVSPSFK